MGKYVSLDVRKASKEDIAKGLALLEKQLDHKEKVKRGEVKGSVSWKDLPEEKKVEIRLKEKKTRIKNSILVRKALEAGITVTESEISAAMEK